MTSNFESASHSGAWLTDWRRHFLYWVVPSLIVLAYIAMYFSGQPFLRNLIAPTINREFGLLENTQVLIILSALVIASIGFKRAGSQSRRLLFLVAASGCLFLFLEEIDYGLHIWEQITGIQIVDIEAQRNLHNIGDNTQLIKRATDAVMILGFVLLPFFSSKVSERWIFFVPERHSAITAVCAFLLSRLAHMLADGGYYVGGPISKNISEFREVFTYYLWLALLAEMVFVRMHHRSNQRAS